MLKQYQSLIVCLSVVLLGGCSSVKTIQYSDMESLALCQSDEQAQKMEKRITAEYGFKRFAKNTYRPVIPTTLFGHEVRVIELKEKTNKLYVAGNPKEFGHHFKWLLGEVSCDKKTCQAPIDKDKTLRIYNFKLKKAKDTTVIECTKPAPIADTDTAS